MVLQTSHSARPATRLRLDAAAIYHEPHSACYGKGQVDTMISRRSRPRPSRGSTCNRYHRPLPSGSRSKELRSGASKANASTDHYMPCWTGVPPGSGWYSDCGTDSDPRGPTFRNSGSVTTPTSESGDITLGVTTIGSACTQTSLSGRRSEHL